MNLDLPPLTPEEEKKIQDPDPDFVFSWAVLFNALEVAWQFLLKRGAKETRYASSLELRLPLYYLGHNDKTDPDEVRMLRTTGDWKNSAWEVEDHGYTFEVDSDKVSCPTIKNPAKARQELYRMLLSMMAICGTEVEWKESMRSISRA